MDNPLPRGVYWLDGVRDEHGYELLIAVDRRGRWIQPPTRVFPREDRPAVIRMLRRLLDRADPHPPSVAARAPPVSRHAGSRPSGAAPSP